MVTLTLNFIRQLKRLLYDTILYRQIFLYQFIKQYNL